METRFTPGPWLVQDERDGDWAVWTRQPHTGTLAVVRGEDINGAYPAAANATLIAAAPILYKALDNCPLPSSMGTASEHFQRFYEWFNGPVSAALALARGEHPTPPSRVGLDPDAGTREHGEKA